VARYSWVDHYEPLRRALAAVAGRLEGDGWRATVLVDDNALVDREAARRAGLGWYGKNTNLLLPGKGSWFVLGTVITDAPLAAAETVADGCGTCERCLAACPTGALVAPGVLDARRCLAWLVQAPGVFPTEYRVALGDRMYGCDDCQDVCPVNRRAARSDPPGEAELGAEPDVDALWVLGASDSELLARYGRWYIPRRQPRHLRRNALLVIGNGSDPDDPAVLAALGAALGDIDPLVRAHAVWAVARLGHPEMLEAVAEDPDPLVGAELAGVDGVAPRRHLRSEVSGSGQRVRYRRGGRPFPRP
jgi:epoxyqueuosine reductase